MFILTLLSLCLGKIVLTEGKVCQTFLKIRTLNKPKKVDFCKKSTFLHFIIHFVHPFLVPFVYFCNCVLIVSFMFRHSYAYNNKQVINKRPKNKE